jgi:hypothetical protein
MEAITKGPAFGDRKLLHADVLLQKIQGHLIPEP